MQEQQGIAPEANFPEKFVLARRGYSDNIWRFHCVEAKKRQFRNNHQEYDIIDSDWRRSMTGADWVLDPERVDTNQYIVYRRNPPRPEPLRLPYYYITGVSLVKNGYRYPIIEFTCSNFFPECDKDLLIPVTRKEEFRKILGDVNNKQWHCTLPPRMVPVPLSARMPATPPRIIAPVVAPPAPARPSRRSPPPSPIPFRLQRSISRPPHPYEVTRDDSDDDSDDGYPTDIRFVESPILRPTHLDIPTSLIDDEDFYELPRPVPRSRIHRLVPDEDDDSIPLAFRVHDEPAPRPAPVPIPLPKHVGDMLIKSAREGTESCPISANLYSECDVLTVTSCFHVFQKESLAIWQKDHDTCPVCRMKIINVVNEVSKNKK